MKYFTLSILSLLLLVKHSTTLSCNEAKQILNIKYDGNCCDLQQIVCDDQKENILYIDFKFDDAKLNNHLYRRRGGGGHAGHAKNNNGQFRGANANKKGWGVGYGWRFPVSPGCLKEELSDDEFWKCFEEEGDSFAQEFGYSTYEEYEKANGLDFESFKKQHEGESLSEILGISDDISSSSQGSSSQGSSSQGSSLQGSSSQGSSSQGSSSQGSSSQGSSSQGLSSQGSSSHNSSSQGSSSYSSSSQSSSYKPNFDEIQEKLRKGEISYEDYLKNKENTSNSTDNKYTSSNNLNNTSNNLNDPSSNLNNTSNNLNNTSSNLNNTSSNSNEVETSGVNEIHKINLYTSIVIILIIAIIEN